MIFIFMSYLLILALLLVAMIKDRMVKTDGSRFLKSGSFWEAYIIGVGLTALFVMIVTSKEIQFTDNLFLN
ncbi:hypothetical protein WBG78_04410 [Chryseolinea sp. T2]|uniref:hypothetical protein n=1 Tax=Chryseolinea sp. T2 TaxID=3129255 RepID=UPI003076DC56